MERKQVRRILESLDFVPPLPPAVDRTLKASETPAAGTTDTTALPSRGLIARTLKLANLSLRKFPREITTVTKCSLLMEFDAFADLLIGASAGTKMLLKEMPPDTANDPGPEEAFISRLSRDAEPFFDERISDQYAALVGRLCAPMKDQKAAGRALLAKWRLLRAYQTATRRLRAPLSRELCPKTPAGRLREAMRLAGIFTRSHCGADDLHAPMPTPDAFAWLALRLCEEREDALLLGEVILRARETSAIDNSGAIGDPGLIKKGDAMRLLALYLARPAAPPLKLILSAAGFEIDPRWLAADCVAMRPGKRPYAPAERSDAAGDEKEIKAARRICGFFFKLHRAALFAVAILFAAVFASYERLKPFSEPFNYAAAGTGRATLGIPFSATKKALDDGLLRVMIDTRDPKQVHDWLKGGNPSRVDYEEVLMEDGWDNDYLHQVGRALGMVP